MADGATLGGMAAQIQASVSFFPPLAVEGGVTQGYRTVRDPAWTAAYAHSGHHPLPTRAHIRPCPSQAHSGLTKQSYSVSGHTCSFMHAFIQQGSHVKQCIYNPVSLPGVECRSSASCGAPRPGKQGGGRAGVARRAPLRRRHRAERGKNAPPASKCFRYR